MRGMPRRPFGARLILIFAATLIACALATRGRAEAQSWTVTQAADVASYSAVGQTINYTYTVTNLTGSTIHNVSIDDDLLGNICTAANVKRAPRWCAPRATRQSPPT